MARSRALKPSRRYALGMKYSPKVMTLMVTSAQKYLCGAHTRPPDRQESFQTDEDKTKTHLHRRNRDPIRLVADNLGRCL